MRTKEYDEESKETDDIIETAATNLYLRLHQRFLLSHRGMDMSVVDCGPLLFSVGVLLRRVKVHHFCPLVRTTVRPNGTVYPVAMFGCIGIPWFLAGHGEIPFATCSYWNTARKCWWGPAAKWPQHHLPPRHSRYRRSLVSSCTRVPSTVEGNVSEVISYLYNGSPRSTVLRVGL